MTQSTRPFLFLILSSLLFVQIAHAHIPMSNIEVRKVKTDLTGTETEFRKWLFERKPYPQKEALLEGTIKEIAYPYPNIGAVHWSQITMSDANFDKILNTPVDLHQVNFRVYPDAPTYEYHTNGTFWVDFADAASFGGGFRGKGNLEEERLFFQFPQLAHLAFALASNPPLPVKPGATGIFPTTEQAQPFIVFDVLRRFDIEKIPYSDALKLISKSQVFKDIKTLSSPYKKGNIIGIASLNWCQTNPPIATKQYRLSNLKYILKESLLGNLGAVMSLIEYSSGHTTASIHSGQWGTGAFGNSLHMVTAIQILSGILSQVDSHGKQYGISLHLHGVDKNIIREAENIVKGILNQQGGTPLKVLDHLLSLQKSSPTDWQPRQKCP